MTYVLMSLLVLVFAIVTLWGIKYEKDKNSFMTIEDTKFLRGFWCIVVVLVHVPELYQNRIQDMIGSFAYIGVTFFFMTSAYGLKWSILHKTDYMKHFWRRRLPPILLPALIANAISVIIRCRYYGERFKIVELVNINNWVKVLLLYYFIFWLIYGVMQHLIAEGSWQDYVICFIVFAFSLITYFSSLKITLIWIVEPLGFAYGILSAKYDNCIKNAISKEWLLLTVSFFISSGFLGIAYLRFKPIPFWGDYLLKAILGIAITSFIYILVSKLRVGNKINGFLGDISYEVYILHGAFFSLLSAVWVGYNSAVYIAVAIAATLLAAVLLKRLCQLLLNR